MAGSFNDGHSISQAKAIKIAKRLRKNISNGNVEKHEKEWKKQQAKDTAKDSFSKNYPFAVKNVEEFATFLEQCGGFSIC